MIDWDALVQLEGAKLLNYVYKILGDVENSQDIVQETFMACFQNIDNLDSNFILPWLYRTAHNKALNFAKKNKRLVASEILEVADSTDIEANLRQERLQLYIRKCFQQMKPKHALVLELQLYQNKSYKEISEITGMTIPAVESILSRARKECKNILQGFKDMGVI
ncbi:MAG: sigma-70 family RNA polymerase sigma factor [Candidatus Cloacimonetes bacterium]|nr:sigma-70 family RNA polymerase sigma factor [Candidatus Cloacimonadota bacterium]